MLTYLRNNSNVLEWPNPLNTESGLPPDNMEATLLDADGAEVGGQSWPVPMLPDADNNWRATLSPTLDVERCESMIAVVEATDVAGGIGTIQARVAVRNRNR